MRMGNLNEIKKHREGNAILIKVGGNGNVGL
jgi:hypothetical protein